MLQGPFPLPTLSCILLQLSCALWLYGEWETKSMRVEKATEQQQEAEIYFNRPSSHHRLFTFRWRILFPADLIHQNKKYFSNKVKDSSLFN